MDINYRKRWIQLPEYAISLYLLNMSAVQGKFPLHLQVSSKSMFEVLK